MNAKSAAGSKTIPGYRSNRRNIINTTEEATVGVVVKGGCHGRIIRSIIDASAKHSCII